MTQSSSSKLAEIRGLTVTYAPTDGPRVVALDNVSLDVFSGDVIGIVGESGSGKSTLAASLLRLLPAGATYQGSIQFGDHDLLAMKESEMRTLRGAQISLIPQDPAICLNPVIRVGDQIAEVLRAHRIISRAERKQRVRQLLEEVCLDAERLCLAYPHELSGGQRQRVVIAQAVACRPALIIADEATSKLDATVQAEILELLSNIQRRHGTAMILITHDPAIVAGFCNRVVVMHAGRIVEQGNT
ncbi:MAG TPA: ABC transporter ATP-binding protein [Verrucomicrobiae bacterium]|nr:ABC transporter ATP-binding protein [Verrucomicrobiae bacterium]